MAIVRAIRKYGADKFHMIEIEECDDDKLNEREIYWIAYYDSYHYGYNCTLGGDGKHKFDYDWLKELYEQGYTVSEIAEITKYKRHSVLNALRGMDWFNNTLKQDALERVSTQVSQYDLDGNYIQTFYNLNVASKAISGSRSALSKAVQRHRPVWHNYQWRLGNSQENIGKVDYTPTVVRQVVQLDDNKNFIKVFHSSISAGKELNISYRSINLACKRKTKAGSYYWAYYDEYVKQQQQK